MSVFPVVNGVALRATKINSCGLPIAGPANRLVTDGFVSFKLTPVMQDAEEKTQKNAAGKICIDERTPAQRKWYTIEAQLCQVNTGLITLFNGWPQVLGYDDTAIGFADQTDVEADYGVALEVWTGGKADDDCPPQLDDSIFSNANQSGLKYGYLLLGGKEFTLGDIEISDAVANFTLSGITMAIPQWGRGPYNVQDIDSDGTAGRLLTPIGSDQHFTLFRTPIAPPPITNGGEPVALEIATKFTSPDFYFGPTPADVAPEQDASTVVVTIVGTPTGGQFILNINGHITEPIAIGATPAEVQAAITAQSGLIDDNIVATVTGSAGGPWTIVFPGGGAEVTAEGSFTGGTSPHITVTTS